MQIEHQIQDGIHILRLSGNMIVGKVDELKKHISDLKNQKYVIANLKEVEYVDSSGIGVLIYLWQYLKEQEGVLAVCDLNDKVKRLFAMAHLEDFIKVYSVEADALNDATLKTPHV